MKIVENTVNNLILHGKCTEDDKEVVIYGLMLGIEMIVFIITLIALGLVFNLVFEGLAFFASFTLIRTYAGGYHCNSGKSCYISSSIIVLIFFSIIKYASTILTIEISLSMLAISIIIISKYAPIDSCNNPLDSVTKIQFRNKMIRNLIAQSILIVVLIFLNQINYASIISLGIFASSILVLVKKTI